MGEFMKKQRLPFYFGVIAMILGVAAIICTFVSNSISSAYEYNELVRFVVMMIIGIVLIAVSLIATKSKGNYNYVSSICIIATIMIFTFVIGGIISERILLASGLLSYNSQNMTGWSVFYASVGAIGCLLVSVILMILSGFMKQEKEA